MNTINQDMNERLDRIEAWMEQVEAAVKNETLNVDQKTLERLKKALGK
jgi:hypothetical protein